MTDVRDIDRPGYRPELPPRPPLTGARTMRSPNDRAARPVWNRPPDPDASVERPPWEPPVAPDARIARPAWTPETAFTPREDPPPGPRSTRPAYTPPEAPERRRFAQLRRRDQAANTEGG